MPMVQGGHSDRITCDQELVGTLVGYNKGELSSQLLYNASTEDFKTVQDNLTIGLCFVLVVACLLELLLQLLVVENFSVHT